MRIGADDFDKMIAEMDTDGSGEVEFDEFVKVSRFREAPCGLLQGIHCCQTCKALLPDLLGSACAHLCSFEISVRVRCTGESLHEVRPTAQLL